MEKIIAELLLGESHAIRELRRLIGMLAPRNLPVLIEGESGVGKELVARALHEASGRRGALVSFNVCAIPESMFEASLFGHVRGAFSGAVNDSDGLLTQGDRGTVFLDEIGSLVPTVQPKLLRALELGEYRPVGARHDRRSDFRVVAATNESIAALVARGSFRADLAYRLRGCVLKVPALRDRKADIPVLATYFLRQNALRFGDETSLSKRAVDLLCQHPWPGNVRELRSVLDFAAMVGSGVIDAITMQDALAQQGPEGAGDEAGRSDQAGGSRERSNLLAALEAVNWDTDRLAREWGVARATVYRQMARLGVAPRARQASRLRRALGGLEEYVNSTRSSFDRPMELSS